MANEGQNLVGQQINQDEFENSESEDEKVPEKNEDD